MQTLPEMGGLGTRLMCSSIDIYTGAVTFGPLESRYIILLYVELYRVLMLVSTYT